MEDGTAYLFNDEQQNLSKDKLEQLNDLCGLYKQLEADIEDISKLLSEKSKALEEVSRTHIPTLLNEVGLSELRLISGQKVIIEDKLQASIADKNYLLAYQNMISAEGGDENATLKIDSLFKSKVVLSEAPDEVLEMLIEQGIPYDLKRDIHHQTLKKYCRDRLDKGLTIPEGISVFQYQETKIK